MKPISFLILLFLLSGSSFGISIEFKNNTDSDLIIDTAQYGGTPRSQEESILTKVIEIKKHSSTQIFLQAAGSWLRWEARSDKGDLIQSGTIHLSPTTKKHHIIDIRLPEPANEEPAN